MNCKQKAQRKKRGSKALSECGIVKRKKRPRKSTLNKVRCAIIRRQEDPQLEKGQRGTRRVKSGE